MLSATRSDGGFTIIESSVAILIVGILLAGLYSVVIRVNQEATDQVALADAQQLLRDAAHDIDGELRQASADTDKGNEVQKLAWDEIQFLSYVNANSDLQLHRYWLQGDCTTGCDLNKEVFAQVPSSDPPAYQTTPLFTSTLTTGLIASPTDPAFVGQKWSSGSLSTITSCDESGTTPCDFSLVQIALRADPTPFGAVSEVVIKEQVRIRNAR